MVYYAVIDTNVLVSALLSSRSDAATVQVVDKVFDGDVIPLFSEEILDEYNEVLRRDKIVQAIKEILSLVSIIIRSAISKYGCPPIKTSNKTLVSINTRIFFLQCLC